jgi:GT2 family glycosyltransferase
VNPRADALSVVICAYTDERWPDLRAAVASVRDQEEPPGEIVVVIDHNPQLLDRARAGLGDGVTVVPNAEVRGLSGGRNTGTAVATGAVVAFLDDDATARPDWTRHLLAPYTDPAVLGVGGRVEPAWDEARPPWLPEEFDWVVGCTYAGHRDEPGPVRNVIGANMSVRRDVLESIGGFHHSLGRTADVPAGCEETELFIRATQRFPGGTVWYEPRAVVSHRVPATRATSRYFRSRCYAEGISKTRISRLVGSRDGLASERAYTTRTLPKAVVRELRAAARTRDRDALARAGTLVTGVATTAAGFASAKVPDRWRRRARRAPATPFVPARIVVVDVASPVQDLAPAALDHPAYARARALVRDGTTPLGVVDLALGEDGGLTAPELAAAVERGLGVSAPVDGELIDLLDPAPVVSRDREPCAVVVATRDRVDALARCIESLRALDPPAAQIVVVDNCSTGPETMALVGRLGRHDPRIVGVREERPGLARAHNRGLELVTTPLVAFTDDDVVADPAWLGALVDAFARETDAGCVTGMIFPLELETAAQGWLESYAGFNKGFSVEVFDRSSRATEPLFPYAAGSFGSGANMAFRTDVLRRIRGFDPALGAGTTARGGDDLAAFFDVIAAGWSVVYEPRAIVLHQHHRTFAALERQTYGYGVGLTAYLTKTVLDDPARALDMLARFPRAVRHALDPQSAKNARLPVDTPRGLVWRERRGMAEGPVRYLRSRWEARADVRPGPVAFPRPSARPVEDVPLPDGEVQDGGSSEFVSVMHGRHRVGG